MDTVLSGIRATGRLHFGNFFGAVQNFVKYQAQGLDCYYFIADLHTLTTLEDPAELRGNVLEIAKDYLAAGLDPDRATLYVQSSVPQIAELQICLGAFQPLGELLTIPTYKELVRKHPERVTHGLVSYPVLMAADILGCRATLIPVGEDQIPNVELARDLARRFNSHFGTNTFPVPEMMEEMVKVPGLDGQKMGKSDADNAIDINMPIDKIGERYAKRGITDPQRQRLTDPGDPYHGCQSVYPIHELVTPGERQTRTIANACRGATIGCGDCKKLLVESLGEIITPFQEKRAELATRDEEVREILIEGGRQARKRFADTLDEVKELMGVESYV